MDNAFVCKTIQQHNREPVPDEVMGKLLEIAEDYCKVKNYVYARYGGIGSLPKLYPGYTIQNEMTRSGLRDELNMPSVYFYLAMFDALGDIKSQWMRTKNKVLELIAKNEELSAEEKHYLRYAIKVSNVFEAELTQQPVKLPQEMKKKYQEMAEQVNTEKLHRYLCRQVRKYHVSQHTKQALGFSISERAYRYQDHGIYISIKEKRRRVFIPLTENNRYKSQIYLKLYPEEKRIVIHVPVNVTVKNHEDFTNKVGVSAGMHVMLTTDQGRCYGRELGTYQSAYADWMRTQTTIYNQNRSSNPGRKKYKAQKQRLTEQMHSYINHELNIFLQTEKPQIVYMVKLPKPQAGGVNRKINHAVSMWQRGYIRNRLLQKCKEQSVEVVEVLGKNISNECSCCGEIGSREDGKFICRHCGYQADEKQNTARNVLKRGLEGRVLK